LFARIRAEFAAAVAGRPNDLNGLFAHLVEVLDEHFHHEEEGGYFNEIAINLPRLAGTVDRLKRQHGVLLDTANVMRLRLLRPEDSVVSLRAMQVEFDSFLQQCKDHETREDELVREAYWQDIGALD
jgi:hemerythrin-like domain-containing protein